MKLNIRTVALIGKPHDPLAAEHIVRLAGIPARARSTVVLEQGTAALLRPDFAPTQPLDTIGKNVDLAVVVGGDGTLLNVARHLAPHRVPALIGVNLGRLGFLADIPPDDMTDAIGRILDGDYQSESRLPLAAEIMRKGKIVHTASAFNDVIVTKGEPARLIEFETYLDGEFVNSARGDGVVVASLTGSTRRTRSPPAARSCTRRCRRWCWCRSLLTLSNRPIVVSERQRHRDRHHRCSRPTSVSARESGRSIELCTRRHDDRIFVRRAECGGRAHPSVRPQLFSTYCAKKLHWGKNSEMAGAFGHP